MARFYPGQRVLIKWSVTWPELNGLPGTITGQADLSRRHEPGCEWLVLPDGYASNRIPSKKSPSGLAAFCPNSEQLEPLTDSNTLVSWESMRNLWVPEHLRVKA